MSEIDGLIQTQVTLLIAASDMDQAAAAAEALEAEGDNVDLMRALETAVAACYGRPFTKPKGGLVMMLQADKWVPAAHRDLHDKLIQLRHQTYAHTDAASGRHARLGGVNDSNGVVHSTYSEGWWPFPREWIGAVVTLCRSQAARFRAEAAAIQARLPA